MRHGGDVLEVKMAESKSNANTPADEGNNPPIFHDFLGRSCPPDSLPVNVKPAAGGDARMSDVSPSASASVGGSSGGGLGPISTTTSDLGSERQVRNHFEGVPFYTRSDLTGADISHRFTGNKRSKSDSAFMGSSKDGFPQVRSDFLDGAHLMKIFQNSGGEQPRHSHDEAMISGMHPMMRPISTPHHHLHPAASSRTDRSMTKWEQAVTLNVSPTLQYPPGVDQVAPLGCQLPSNRFKDYHAGPSVISQTAADEGSRTGIKRSAILSSINASGGLSDRNPSGALLSGSKEKNCTHISEPESSTPVSQQGLASPSHQMTIFYGGQAHVFDDVHPNKADVIMALAGSNGGSWSTNYLPKSATIVPGERHAPGGENEIDIASNFAASREFRGKLSVMGTSSHGFAFGDRISVPPGIHQGSVLTKEGKTPVQAAEIRTKEKQERVD